MHLKSLHCAMFINRNVATGFKNCFFCTSTQEINAVNDPITCNVYVELAVSYLREKRLSRIMSVLPVDIGTLSDSLLRSVLTHKTG